MFTVFSFLIIFYFILIDRITFRLFGKM
uniref:Uncharacterized protein n=1 Tax=Anguilla anguilla TaxID=7936 RepID=A0A0E9T1X7_ANGAN